MHIVKRIMTLTLVLAFAVFAHAHGEKPTVPGAPRLQPPVPQGFKEISYSEKHQLPEFTAQEQADGFMLFSRSITQPVYKTSIPLASERVDGVSAFATLGEYEPVTFSVYPLRDIKNMRVKISDLKNGDSVIGQKDLDLRLVTSWNMRYPLYVSKDTYQNVPELLEAVTVNSFAEGECQRYWLTVHAPTNAKPGIYTGEFTISDDATKKAVRLPVTFRVLDYALQQDPAKRYSVYYDHNDNLLRNMPESMVDTITGNEYSAMQKYGIDMFPTIACYARTEKNGTLELYIPHPEAVEKMIRAGFKGPIPLIAEAIPDFYKKYVPGGKIGGHFTLSEMPSNDAIYKEIEQAFRKLNLECKAKGWPELICCPVDEPNIASADFVSKVYAAVRKSGMKTFITKDPTSADVNVFRKRDAIDAWCSQPFSMPYEKVIADKRYEYWSYPNHSAGEIKDRVTMQKGGRMTYGFGFWRSGYTVLIPWHWRWTAWKGEQFNYLSHPTISGCGCRIDEQGNVIPAIYWECFREGRDDARYVYTLEQAIYERRNSQDPRCRELIKQGEALLQRIWDSIIPQQKYMIGDMWPDKQFTVARWQLAGLTEKLLKFPATDKGNAPSVMVNTEKPTTKTDAFALASESGALESFNLGENKFAGWEAFDKEASIKTAESAGQPVLCMTVNVDHKMDGAGKSDKYPIGWPGIMRTFTPGVVMTDYDFLEFNVKIDSNRDEVADDRTPLAVNFIGADGFKYTYILDLGDRQREWFPVRIAISNLIKESGLGISKWTQPLQKLQLVIFERNYQDGARLQFDFDRIALIKVKHPIIAAIECPEAVLLPAKYFSMDITNMGVSGSAAKDHDQLTVKLSSKDGKIIASQTVNLSAENNIALNLEGIIAGQYRLEVEIVNKAGKTISSRSKSIEAIAGYH